MDREDMAKALEGIDDEYIQILCGDDRGRMLNTATAEVNKAVGGDKAKIAPAPENLFATIKRCNYASLKCVIIGQDPYPKKGDAIGSSFSAPRDRKTPASLAKIYKCLQNCGEITALPSHPNLSSWEAQGVLLLNLTLTTEVGKSRVHANIWSNYMNAVIEELSRKTSEDGKQITWMLWGNDAKSISGLIRKGCENADANALHLARPHSHNILEWGHPSPLSSANRDVNNLANFLYCDHFSKVNEFLRDQGEHIDWNII